MTDISIPPEALEAGARVICNTDNPLTMAEVRDLARAAFRAMVKAWEGAGIDWCDDERVLALPLPPAGETNE